MAVLCVAYFFPPTIRTPVERKKSRETLLVSFLQRGGSIVGGINGEKGTVVLYPQEFRARQKFEGREYQ